MKYASLLGLLKDITRKKICDLISFSIFGHDNLLDQVDGPFNETQTINLEDLENKV